MLEYEILFRMLAPSLISSQGHVACKSNCKRSHSCTSPRKNIKQPKLERTKSLGSYQCNPHNKHYYWVINESLTAYISQKKTKKAESFLNVLTRTGRLRFTIPFI